MINFIHCWKNVVSAQECGEIIQAFEDKLQQNPELYTSASKYYDQKITNLHRNDISTSLDIITENKNLCESIYDRLWNCYFDYTNTYGQVGQNKHTCSELKVQKTPPYGGFHAWHYEQGSLLATMARELVWTIYLNDMPDNEGETEFIYQAVKVKPQTGLLCVFPAAMTHVHRGLTVYTRPKYIITGWFLREIKDYKILDAKQLMPKRKG